MSCLFQTDILRNMFIDRIRLPRYQKRSGNKVKKWIKKSAYCGASGLLHLRTNKSVMKRTGRVARAALWQPFGDLDTGSRTVLNWIL